MPNPIRPGAPRVPGPPTGPSTYRVQSGDSLSAIAARFSTTVDAIMAANGLANADRIFPGQVLEIPSAGAPSGLSAVAGRQFTFAELWPSIQEAATRHGADAQVMAAIVRQESSFINHRVHRDGTGHGLIGLDDGGRLPEFERYSGLRVGRGRSAVVIPPDRQLDYLARTLASSTQRYGDPLAAAREWHRGHGGMNDRLGQQYQDLIEGHIQALFS